MIIEIDEVVGNRLTSIDLLSCDFLCKRLEEVQLEHLLLRVVGSVILHDVF